MRPRVIAYFKALIFASLALGIVQAVLSWGKPGANHGFILVTGAITILLVGGLTLLVSRLRSRVALWISIVLFLLGLPIVFQIIAHGLVFRAGAIAVLQALMQAVAYGLLFTAPARAWLSGSTPAT